MKGLKRKIRDIINNPPARKVKCSCRGYDIIVGYEPDGPNASDWGNAIYGRCCSGITTIEDTDKMIKLIIEVCRSQK